MEKDNEKIKSKPKSVLGIHDGHNSTVAVLQNGELTDVLQEERLIGEKNIGDFPKNALNDVVERNDLLSDNPLVSFNGLYMRYGVWGRKAILDDYGKSKSIASSLKAIVKKNPTIYSLYKSSQSKNRLAMTDNTLKIPHTRIFSVEHHTAHAAAAYYGWGKKGKILALTCDGNGDGLSATVNICENDKIDRIAAITEDHSIGRLYAFITYLMGMMPLEHEYKIMGLAPYSGISRDVIRVQEKFSKLFEFDSKKNGLEWRRSDGVPTLYAPQQFLDKLIQRERFDWIAAGLQLFIENFLKQWVQNCIRETGIRRVALSGGVFMNVKANKIIYELPEVDELFIFPSCGDESNAIGSAYYTYQDNFQDDIQPLTGIYFGKAIDDQEVERTIAAHAASTHVQVKYKDDIENEIAKLLAAGKIVGRIKGKMEYGARSLGNRSILANASMPGVIRIINEMIKNRDFWMPFAPSVLAETSEKYFIKPKPVVSPYMMLSFDTRPEMYERIMAALHPFDYTARPQEVVKDWNPDYHKLIKYYEEYTGDSIILNTSYNLHGFPIAYSAKQALDVFQNSGLRFLALGNFLLSKEDTN
ncbi:carbamoyltransferase C-terminal domain-containing protein [Thermodesulfobacteriota bacterium]